MKLAPTLEIDLPIVLAPAAGAVGPELCAAVCKAGGLGMLPVWHAPPAELRSQLEAVRALTDRPFGINLNNHFDAAGHLDAAIDAGAGSVSFFWGLKPALLQRARAAGMVTLQTVGTAAEAQEAVKAGADIIVAQGWEAGGHVWGKVATLALVPAVVDAVAPVPVIAAGGIADGRGLAAVLALGAAAAWIGTRFLMASESLVDADGRAGLIAASEAGTVFGRDHNENWKGSALRWLGQDVPWTTEYSAPGRKLAGQSVGLVRRNQPAAEIVAEMWSEAQANIRHLQHLA